MTSGALVLARASALLSMLVLVPILLTSLDYERFALWMTFSSIVSLMAFTDFGLGNGLMTALASASAKESDHRLQILISNGFAALVLLSVPLALLVVAVASTAPLGLWLGVTKIPAGELRSAVIILSLGVMAGGIAGIAGRVQAGLQTGYIASLWTTAASILMFVCLMAGIYWRLPFLDLVAISACVPIVAGIANTIWYFTRTEPGLRPRMAAVDLTQMAGLFRSGGFFFLLQVAATVTFATDNLIIASTVGVEAVPSYAIPARLFGFISLSVAIIVQPLWPAYAEAAARGDMAWVRQTFLRSLAIAFGLSFAIASILFLLRNQVFPLWTGSQVKIDSSVAAALAVWCVAESCGVAFAMLLNGLKVARFQIAIALAHTLLSLPIRYLFLQRFGLWGLPAATTLVYVVSAIIPCVIQLPKILGTRAHVAEGRFDTSIVKIVATP
ncbi:MAG: oligosaccharide flippase family protein [Steroidobacteraceae bacterium]